jgi:hypothetical protein
VIDQLHTRAAYWDDAAAKYDHNFTGTLIGQTRRHSVWRDLERAGRLALSSIPFDQAALAGRQSMGRVSDAHVASAL